MVYYNDLFTKSTIYYDLFTKSYDYYDLFTKQYYLLRFIHYSVWFIRIYSLKKPWFITIYSLNYMIYYDLFTK